MEEALIKLVAIRQTRLRQLIDSTKQIYESGEMLLESASSAIVRLKEYINRLEKEIRQYTQTSQNPKLDVITEATEIQIQGEDFLSTIESSLAETKSTLSSQPEPHSQLAVKLPKLELPKFNGDYLRWNEFWDRFQSNIHNQTMAEADKLTYLISSLEGKALESVAGLNITNNTYSVAIDILQTRYGSKNMLIDAHYTALANLPRANHSADSCRNTLDEIERHLRVLEKLDENVTGNHLRTIILGKFPEQILHQYHLMTKDDATDISNTRKTLRHIIVAMEKAKQILTCQPTSNTNSTTESITTEALQLRTEARTMSENTKIKINRHKKPNLKRKGDNSAPGIPAKRNRLPCIFCKLQNHPSAECKRYSKTEARKRQLIGRCLKCLKRNHKTENCYKRVSCYRCGEDHLQLLCSKPKGELTYIDNKDTPAKCLFTNSFTFLQTAVTQVQNPNHPAKKHKCRLVLDSGSQRSYISTRLASKLGLTSNNTDLLLVYTFGSIKPKELSSPSTEIILETKRGTKSLIRVNIVPHITDRLPVASFQCSETDLSADDDSVGENIDILIGNDYYTSFIREGKIKIQDSLYVIDSDFGWLLSGNVEQRDDVITQENILTVTTYCHCHDSSCPYFTEPDLPLRNIDIKFLWSLECIGINDSPRATHQEEAVKHFNDTVKYRDGRYEVTWPWIEYPPQLSTNFGLALGRLKSLIKRLDMNTFQEYNEILKEQLERNIIEVVEPHDKHVDHPVHYLPHHMVKTEGKRGRVVYDASAKTTGKKSLNECLYSGPSMLEDLAGLLLKFRTKSIGILSDVEKAFLQVGLQEKDRDVTRFLWIKDINQDLTEENLLYLRFCRVPFGIISSPFLLTATIRYHMKQTDETLLTDIANNCYVDNLVTGANSVQEAREIYEKTRQSFDQISMNIRDWVSNSKEFLESIPADQQAVHEGTVKVLGLSWNVSRDTLKLKINPEQFNIDTSANTKRKVLRALARIYDPCGFICPLTLPLKVLFRNICQRGLKWDTLLPDELIQSMQSIMETLEAASHLEVPRCAIGDAANRQVTYELHGFSDASKIAYASVVYLVTRGQQNTSISLIMAKSRIGKGDDTSELHIPKLELLGLLITSRLLKYLRTNLSLPIKREILWTDSLVVLGWMRSDKLLPPFVSNRVGEIKRNQPQTEIYYVNTKSNPADIATRPDRWNQCKTLWLNGPTFLKEDESRWPTNRHYDNHMSFLSLGEDLDLGKRAEVTVEGPGNPPKTPEVVDDQYMEVDDLTTEVLKGGNMELDSPNEVTPTLNKTHDTLSEIQELQKHHFADEIAGKTTHLSRNLGLFLDVDGVLRCQGRMANTSWTYDMKYPILLPKDCEFTNKIIKDTHDNNYHVGATHTLSRIRERYWIPQGKRQVAKVIAKCQQCVKHGGGPYRLPATPALPAERVNYSTPYTFCGIDYFGPLYVNTQNGKEKRWVALFTCLAVRAIHLEIVNNLTAEECLLAFRRFAATRNTPKRMYSDNAMYFKLTSEVMAKPYCVERGVEWKFIPQLAPWHGGFYERLVGMVKHCLKRTLEKHLLGDSKLLTVLKEIEAVVNSRPLTKVGSEVIHILRPADFLSLGKCLNLTPVTENILPENGSKLKTKLIESWKKGLVIIEEFKKIFMTQYLTSLRERYRNSPKQPRVMSDRAPKVGDIVQIKSDLKNREMWKVGKIAELTKGADGKHRVAKVKVGDTIMTRSIAHLYPLETDSDKPLQSGDTGQVPPLSKPTSEHPDVEVVSNEEHCGLSGQGTPTISAQPENCENEDEIMMEGVPMQMSNEDSMTNDDTPKQVDVTTTPDIILHENRTTRNTRGAALRAREKILEWTRHLLIALQ